jgi:hypothetical protein
MQFPATESLPEAGVLCWRQACRMASGIFTDYVRLLPQIGTAGKFDSAAGGE